MEKTTIKIKVCGMKYSDNIKALSQLPIDYMGMIFYPKSPRYIDSTDEQILASLPQHIGKVGVFVDEEMARVRQMVEKYGLTQVQLHGQESSEYCRECWNLTNVEIIKAFNVSQVSDFEQAKAYEKVCNYFLFDTKTSQHGGSGQKFDWKIVDAYTGKTPFFLSGGISAGDAKEIQQISHPQLYAIDINSKFEVEAGLKDIELLSQFITEIKR